MRGCSTPCLAYIQVGPKRRGKTDMLSSCLGACITSRYVPLHLCVLHSWDGCRCCSAQAMIAVLFPCAQATGLILLICVCLRCHCPPYINKLRQCTFGVCCRSCPQSQPKHDSGTNETPNGIVPLENLQVKRVEEKRKGFKPGVFYFELTGTFNSNLYGVQRDCVAIPALRIL